jgi:hypothetical protein
LAETDFNAFKYCAIYRVPFYWCVKMTHAVLVIR